ncbi:MAG: hypothetical protein JWN78_2995 [Bacteroidota bacterium]|nr:hypothetical protein [Bacteroidota bacterium]
MTKKFLLCIASITVIMISCKKTTDNAAPVITITSPSDGHMFMPVPDSILVTASITDADMHSYTILATNAATGDTLFSQPETHVHDETVTINQKFKASYTTTPIASTAFELEISAEDHNSNESSKTVHFNVMP